MGAVVDVGGDGAEGRGQSEGGRADRSGGWRRQQAAKCVCVRVCVYVYV